MPSSKLRLFLAAIAISFVCLFASESATAYQRESQGPPAAPDQSEEKKENKRALHENLDRRYMFTKKGQSELGIFGGDFVGDEWHNSWDVGAHYYFSLNNTFSVGASYAYTPIYTDNSSTFGQTLTTRDVHILDAEVMISNDTAFRSGGSIIECDLYLTLGMGSIYINSYWRPVWVVGGGMKIYTPVPWFAVRFDVNSYLHSTPSMGKDPFNSDIAMNVGASFIFPPNKVRVDQSSALDGN